MSAVIDLPTLLANLSPHLSPQSYWFCHLPQGRYGDLAELEPVGAFLEREGLTLIVEASRAREHGLSGSATLKKITLQVHSSLEAVGLTAAVSAALSSAGISANVVAAYFHDHIFVPAEQAEQALSLLKALASPDNAFLGDAQDHE